MITFSKQYVNHFDKLGDISKTDISLLGSPTISSAEAKFDNSLYVSNRNAVLIDIDTSFVTGDFTIDFWANIKNSISPYGSSEALFSIYDKSGFSYTLLFSIGRYYADDDLACYANNGSSYFIEGEKLATPTEYKNKWCHYAIVKRGDSYYYFFNGILRQKKTISSVPASTNTICFGKRNGMDDVYTEAYIDELRIIKKAIWTSDFTPPTKPYMLLKPIYLDSLDTVWGIDSTATFKQLATNWSSKSDNDKLALLESVKDVSSVSELSTIGKFKVISMQETTPVTNTTVTAIPKTQTIYPTKLIKTSPFEKLNSVSITATSSGTGDIKIAVTTDLSTYKVWDKVTLAWIDIPKSDIATRGMSVSDVSALTDTEWNMLVSYGVGDGIAFAYSLDITADTDIAEIDELTLNAEMRGSWNKAFHGTDYIYGYPFYDQLRVKLLTDGSYKINYHD